MNLKKLIPTVAIALSGYLYALDNIALTITAPHDSGVVTNDSSISYTFQPITDSSVSKYYIAIDSNPSTDPLGSSIFLPQSYTGSGLTKDINTSGDYYIHIVAVDSSDNKLTNVTHSSKMPIDLDKPTLSMTPLTLSQSAATTVTISANEDGKVYYTTNGNTPTTDLTPATNSVELNLAVSATVKALFVDKAGNKSDVTSKTYTITNNPTLKVDSTTVANKTISTTNSVTKKTSLSVGGSGFTGYAYKFSTDSSYTVVPSISTPIDISTKTTSGAYTIYLKGSDAFSTQSDDAKSSFTFNIDNTKPTNLTSTIGGSTTKTSFSDNFTFALSATDNMAQTLVYKWTTDGTDPITLGTESSTGTTTKTVNTGETSTFNFKFAVKDEVGNWSDVKTIAYTIDKEKPTLTMPSSKEFSTYFDTTISMSETGNIFYLLEQATASTCSASKTIQAIDDNKYSSKVTVAKSSTSDTVTQANFCLYAKAVDAAGNESDVKSTFFTYSANTLTLSLSLTDGESISNSSVFGATNIISKIDIDGANIKTYKYKLNDANYTSSATWLPTSSIDISSFAQGDYNLTVVAYDENATNEVNSSISFIINNIPDNVTVKEIKSGWNMISTPVDITLDTTSMATTFANSDIVWKYGLDSNNSRVWKAYSPKSEITTLITTPLTSINSGEGYWVHSQNDMNITFNGITKYEITTKTALTSQTTGWRLIGTAKDITPTSILTANSKIAFIWNYSNGVWSAYSADSSLNNDINNSSAIDLTTTIKAGNAFWIKVN